MTYIKHVHCSRCGKRCSGRDPELGLVVRAWVECPECLEKEKSEGNSAKSEGNSRAPDLGLLTRRLIQRVVAELPYYASNALNDHIKEMLRQARSAGTDRLVDDLSGAMEFIRELASTSCAWGCIADHPDEQPCIHCRAAKWLHSESQKLGSRVVSVGPVYIGCMAKDSREALDLAMERWRKQQARIPPTDDPVYQFAYWLLRWSGIVTGVNLDAPENPWPKP